MTLNTAGQDLAITSGTLDIAGFNLTVNDSFTMAAGATLKLMGTETVSTPTISSGGTVEYTATTGTITCKNWTYKNLTINGSGGTFQLGESHVGMTNLTVTAGTFNCATYNITMTGTVTVNGGTLSVGSGTTQTAVLNMSSGTINNNTGTIKVTGSNATPLTISGGTFNQNTGLFWIWTGIRFWKR
jgi:phage-related tail fiber protein